MASLDQIIDYTKTFQDVELATAIGQLKKDPSQLQQFLQGQQNKVFKDVTKQKDTTFDKVYGDLNRASQAQESILMYNKRNQELADINKTIYTNQKNSANAVLDDKNLAGRKQEMNEWTVNNKKDTLFVFSMLFIMLSGLLLVTVLWRMGMISSVLWVALSAPMIIIFILTVVNRSQYTDIFRNKRYWNRRIFEGKYGKIPIPLCPGALTGLESDIGSLESDIQVNIAAGAQNIASATQSAAQGISSAAQNISSATQNMSNSMVSPLSPAS
jgi:hypothetical protein